MAVCKVRVKQRAEVQDSQFPSAAVLLETVRDEYHQEKARSSTLDNKANVFISAIIAVVTLFLPIIPFAGLKTVFLSGNIGQTVATTVMLCILVLSVVYLFLAFRALYQAFQLKAFNGVNIQEIDDSMLSMAEKNVQRGLVEHYRTIIVRNMEVNDAKAKRIIAGLKYSIISFALLCVSAVGLILTVGG